MDNIGYTTLTRQSGLMREMQSVANNIANASTTGFRREGIIFSEYVSALDGDDPSLSMATANVRALDLQQGGLTQTGGTFDFAIEGDGFFMVDGPDGQFLTRAGSFTPSALGELSTPDGYRLLDGGGAPVFVPPDARSVSVASDGTLSVDGRAVAQIGLYLPVDQNDLLHREGVRFEAPGGVEPALVEASILQGFIEGSNVNPITEVARMIEVQRSYELGQKFLEKEDERIRAVLKTVGR
ncbi:flagellar hook-basal body complex protein [Aliiroseovarius sediminis]|uniref:flagellar hook-basal body complex protein n=1 Tax=Aliiroseovarius sediminis TaxID=2925839 RepID=UPI001F5AF2CB|nr:flagellar hook-basal body complex protein [Aliiroseovarius sediminis]MCI2394752.1 flagellar hook-basal body complex protein [Aliiroseovarius sediminis]